MSRIKCPYFRGTTRVEGRARRVPDSLWVLARPDRRHWWWRLESVTLERPIRGAFRPGGPPAGVARCLRRVVSRGGERRNLVRTAEGRSDRRSTTESAPGNRSGNVPSALAVPSLRTCHESSFRKMRLRWRVAVSASLCPVPLVRHPAGAFAAALPGPQRGGNVVAWQFRSSRPAFFLPFLQPGSKPGVPVPKLRVRHRTRETGTKRSPGGLRVHAQIRGNDQSCRSRQGDADAREWWRCPGTAMGVGRHGG